MTEHDDASRFIDTEIRAFIARTARFYPDSANSADPATARATYDRLCAAFRARRPECVAVVEDILASRPIRRYRPPDAVPGVVLLYLHGGGFVVGGLESHDDICAELSLGAAVEIVALEYRLAPEHPYPAALDDTEAAYRGLGVRVIVGGDSAGGNLAAALCLRLRRLGAIVPAGQLLIYPALGGDPALRAGPRKSVAPLLTAADMVNYHRLYAGAAEIADDPEFAPLAARDFAGLPPASIFAAGFDPLCPDAEDYAALLHAAGVSVQYHHDPGLVHGYLRARHSSRLAARAFVNITQALRRLATEAVAA